MEMELLSEYGGSSRSHVHKRGATSKKFKLWPSKTVPYVISSSFTSTQTQNILDAMQIWSAATCITFVPRSLQINYIKFIVSDKCSSKVGKYFFLRQYIRLTASCAESNGAILHEIGHALGLWHEQSRPDRDSYVTILKENIMEGKEHNFDKRSDKEVDFQGSEYDYGSIMHYSNTAFVRRGCNGCKTIRVSNDAAYKRQGSPTLGESVRLSSRDITQVNRLYNCPGSGRQGFLALYIRNGVNLEDTDIIGDPDPYVEVKAIDSYGTEYTRETLCKRGTRNPTWNEWLFFSQREWQFFRIRVWDHDTISRNDPMSMSETVPLLENPTRSIWRKFCNNIPCNRYVWFDFKLLTAIRGNLRAYVRYARNLPDTDGWWNNPDSYVQIQAQRPDGSVVSKNSMEIGGTTNPTWNEWVDMGGCSFVGFTVQIFDKDVFFSDEMSDLELVEISAGYHSNIKHCASSSCNSYLYLDYDMRVDGNECSPNPCLNGGTCYDGCATYFCSCPSSYTGDRCESRQGRLTVRARYGMNLPDKDDWPSGDSDPYLKITAYDHNGIHFKKKHAQTQVMNHLNGMRTLILV